MSNINIKKKKSNVQIKKKPRPMLMVQFSLLALYYMILYINLFKYNCSISDIQC